MLVRLHERAWGALAALPSSKLAEAGYSGSSKPANIAVVRDAFAAHDENPRTLADAVQPLGPHSVAISSEITHSHERLVVDQYEFSPSDDHYHLTSIGTDFIRFLRGHGMHLRQVSDVKAAVAAVAAHDNRAAAAAGLSLRQSTNEVLMVAPTAFVFNQQAAQDNSFMNTTTSDDSLSTAVTRQVLKEFSDLYHELTEVAGVKVNLFQHSLTHGTPDACFVNNWFSTHSAAESQSSTLVYYPMKCPNRQAERREDIMGVLEKMGYDRIVDMTEEESKNNRYFEGTGVLVIDRVNGVAYVSLSERADADLAAEWVRQLNYKEAVTFTSSDPNGATVYHTNVMMAIGTSVAVACLESITDDKERKHFVSKLGKTHEILDISQAQMAALCGNVLELEDGRGLPIMAMSTRAFNAFTEEQKGVLRKHVAALHHARIDTLEHIGGGGVRCTLGEIFR